MKTKYLTIVFTVLFSGLAASAQTSWLDRPLDRNWNRGDGVVPNAPRTLAPIDARCRDQIRNPESVADRAVTRAGWSLFGAAQIYGAVTVVNGMSGTDGMCRPMLHNTFVFVGSRFAGTLSPEPMNSRTDGALSEATLTRPGEIVAEYTRYTSNDALCCPSQTSTVNFTVGTDSRAVVRATNVETSTACRPGDDVMETQDNVVSGTVTYRQRSALPPTAVLIVKIVDVSRSDFSAPIIVEQRIDTAGKQVPIQFDIAYDRTKIQERNRYAVQAEIRDGGRLLFITDTSYPVITQGNPRSVDITVVPVGGGIGGGQRSNVIRGTISYSQRQVLPPNAEVTVRLVDSGDPRGTPAAETKFTVGNRQIPIPFELTYEQRDINRQRNYELQAEITVNGEVRFRTGTGKPVALRGIQTENVDLMLDAGTEGTQPITGKTISLSKFGTGSIKIGDRNTQFLIRGSVSVANDGNAQISVSGIDGSVNFSGKLTYFDDTTLRITVDSSGDATASGEIEVKYNGRSLRSLSGTNLVLDGQDVTLRF